MNPLTSPARPINGGPLPEAPVKTGQWYCEPKYNGWRTLVHVPSGTMFNRQGERLSLETEFKLALEELREIHHACCQMEWLDCEALDRRHDIGRGHLIVLDLPGESAQPYSVRRALLCDLFHPLSFHPISSFSERADLSHLWVPPLISWTLGCLIGDRGVPVGLPHSTFPLAATAYLQAINHHLGCEFYEGFVAKRADSLYPIQLLSPVREFPGWVKHR